MGFTMKGGGGLEKHLVGLNGLIYLKLHPLYIEFMRLNFSHKHIFFLPRYYISKDVSMVDVVLFKF